MCCGLDAPKNAMSRFLFVWATDFVNGDTLQFVLVHNVPCNNARHSCTTGLQVRMWQQRLDLCTYDGRGNGYLTVSELQEFILDRIPALPQLTNLDETFYDTYTVYAATKFFFFLDRRRTRRVRIKDMLLSDVFNEFNELAIDEELPMDYEETNWFALPFVSRVHSAYLALDVDGNGLLSKEEFSLYEYTTAAVVERLFQVNEVYTGCVDYKTYLNFVLARENLQTPEAIGYFARLLDLNGKVHRQCNSHSAFL